MPAVKYTNSFGKTPRASTARTYVHARVAAAAMAAAAVLVSFRHPHHRINGTLVFTAWEHPTAGTLSLLCAAVLHIAGSAVVATFEEKASAAARTAGMVLWTVAMFTSSCFNDAMNDHPNPFAQWTPCYLAVSFAMWTAICFFVCATAPATKTETFWVAMAGGFMIQEHMMWTVEFTGDTIEIKGALGGGIIAAAFVIAIGGIMYYSPEPRRDVLFACGASAWIAIRLAAGFHVHHVEWPAYVVFLLRHGNTAAGVVSGILFGFATQEAPGHLLGDEICQ